MSERSESARRKRRSSRNQVGVKSEALSMPLSLCLSLSKHRRTDLAQTRTRTKTTAKNRPYPHTLPMFFTSSCFDFCPRTSCTPASTAASSRAGRCSALRPLRPVRRHRYGHISFARKWGRGKLKAAKRRRTHLIALGINLDLRQCVVVLHVLLSDRSAALNRDGLFVKAVGGDGTCDEKGGQKASSCWRGGRGSRRGRGKEEGRREGGEPDESDNSETNNKLLSAAACGCDPHIGRPMTG